MKLVITPGDPAGVGPEIIRSLLSRFSFPRDISITVVCDAGFRRSLRRLPDSIFHLVGRERRFIPGRPDRHSAKASLEYINQACELISKTGCRETILFTGPVSKELISSVSPGFSGHTELLARSFGVRSVSMVFVCDKLKIVTVTTHCAIKDVHRSITENKIMSGIRSAAEAVRLLEGRPGRIAVLGLNPHAGDGGIIGTEEKNVISAAVRKAKKKGFDVSGPYPSDSGIQRALDGAADAVVAMYHDQAILPVKLISGRKACNLTVGLPFVRVSPLHGTAFDIAGRGNASDESAFYAMSTAFRAAGCG